MPANYVFAEPYKRATVTCIYAFAVHCFKEVCVAPRCVDTILLLRFDETYEPTFRRLHRAKPFSYVHLTMSSTNSQDVEMKEGGEYFLSYSKLLEKN